MRTTTMTRRTLGLVAVIATTLSLAVTAPATAIDQPSYAATIADAQLAIDETLASTGSTSIVAGITDANALIWQGSAGVVDASGAKPTAATMYGIGSTSKMLATAALMQLVDQGKVGLDQPVVKVLPQFTMKSPQHRQITVRMLLNHTSGVPGTSYANGFTTKPWGGYAQQVFDYLARSTLKTTPGAMSVYANDGFTLAGEVVAAVSGMPFTTYVERNLLAPLGMTHSEYVTTGLPAPGAAARIVVDGRNTPLEVTNVYASGGLMSNPTDMSAFARMLLNKGDTGSARLLSAQSVAEMGRLQIATTLDPIERNEWKYGLGWDTVANLSLAAVGERGWVKGGDTADYHSGLLVAPDAGLAVFVAGAGRMFSSSDAEAIAERIMLHALAERGDIAAVPAKIGNDQPAAVTPTPDDINAMLGVYLGTPSMGFRVVRGEGDTLVYDQLVIDPSGASWHRHPGVLTLRHDGWWWPDLLGAVALRTVTGWGRTYLVLLRPTGFGNALSETVLGQRVASNGPSAPAWSQRTGVWLAVSDRPESMVWRGEPAAIVEPIDGLPGYAIVSAASPVDTHDASIGSMFLQVPYMFGRDLDDLVPLAGGLLRQGTAVMRPLASVPTLAAGSNAVRIGTQGYAEWREVTTAGRISVKGSTGWNVYDESLERVAGALRDGTVQAPNGALLVVFGKPGQTVTITR